MHKFFLKIPWWVRRLYPARLWKMPPDEKCVYLTFDDGPHPTITPWVLRQLAAYGANATFFCIGKNVEHYPHVYKQVLADGHAVGNHTYSHLNGWKTPDKDYLADVAKASRLIDSPLFRPPYGRLRGKQAMVVADAMRKKGAKIVMWDVLSADFDASIDGATCTRIVMKRAEAGSIIVFHDSEKAFVNLQETLPRVLQLLADKGFSFKALPTGSPNI